MSFLAFILALGMLKFWDGVGFLQSDDWFHRWRAAVASVVSGEVLTLVLVLLPLMIAVHLLGESISGLLFGLPWIALAALLLVYAFGRGDVPAVMEQYRSALREGDFPVYTDASEDQFDAELDAAELNEGEFNEEGNGEVPLPQELHSQNQQYFFYEDYQGWFVVVFYFLVLGPGAALAYRLLQVYCDTTDSDAAHNCLFFVDWVPARMLAASYAVTGDFVRSADELMAAVGDTQMDAGEVLSSVGIAALGPAPEPAHTPSAFGAQAARESEEVASLMSRTSAAWIALVAIWVVFT
ncbi:MAG: AmpE protein [Bacteroidia bacterium]|jgi:AmpE protein